MIVDYKYLFLMHDQDSEAFKAEKSKVCHSYLYLIGIRALLVSWFSCWLVFKSFFSHFRIDHFSLVQLPTLEKLN